MALNLTWNNLTSPDLNQLPSHMVTNYNIEPSPTEQWRLSNLKFGKLDRKSLLLTELMIFQGSCNEYLDSSSCNEENHPLVTPSILHKSVEPKSKTAMYSKFFVPLRTTTNLSRDTPPNLKTATYRCRLKTIVNVGNIPPLVTTLTDKEVNPISVAQVTSSKPNDGVEQTNVAATTKTNVSNSPATTKTNVSNSPATTKTNVCNSPATQIPIDGVVDHCPLQQITSSRPNVGVDPTSILPMTKTLSNEKAVDPALILQVSPPNAKNKGVSATITMTNKKEVVPNYFIRSRLRSTQKIRSNAGILSPKTTPKKTVPIWLPNSPKSPKNKARTSQLKQKLLKFIRKDLKDGQVLIRQLPLKKKDKVTSTPTSITTPNKKNKIASLPATSRILAETLTTSNDRQKKTYKYNVWRVKPKSNSKKVRPKLCELCGKTSTNLNDHVRRVHHGIKDIKCKVCEKNFKSEEENAQHQGTHDLTRKAYGCKFCCESFFTKRQRFKHFSTKHAEKRFTCEHCDKGFINRDKLRNHVGSVHGGPKNYVCEVCGKAYVQKTLLDYHVREHSDNVKPFCCGYCDICYTSKYTMLNHVKARHTKETAREVEYCPKCLKGYLTVNFVKHECTT